MKSTVLKIKPTLEAATEARFELSGGIGILFQNIVDNWLLPLPGSNPGILEMFRDRDVRSYRKMLPWAGEFAGKYLTCAVQNYRLGSDERLRNHIDWFVGELVSLQAEDGYLGPWPRDYRLTGHAPNCYVRDQCRLTWDAWGHYHIMLGLLLWHRQTGDTRALECVRRIGDLFCNRFGGGSERLVDTGNQEKNMAPIHSLCLLYETTGEKSYLEMARRIEKEFAIEPAGDYVQTALEGKEFYQTPMPRWESLHCIQGICELYFLTGEERLRKAFEHIWWSIVKLDRHNTGGFSSGEGAAGSPYNRGAIETCCTVAWMALTVDMLRLTGSSVAADELELSMYNGGMGALSPSARWCTYNTPMDGFRRAFVEEVGWQVHPGTPELNCCSVNSTRSVGFLSEWALMKDHEGLALNYYGPGTLRASVESAGSVELILDTEYPKEGEVTIHVNPEREAEFALKLRIPHWSRQSTVVVNGEKQACRSGTYLVLKRRWKNGDRIDLYLDMSLHFWKGEKEVQGRSSIYRGPILLAYDPAFDEGKYEDGPLLDARKMEEKPALASGWWVPWMLFEYPAADGKKVRLCDFRSAGMSGTPYRSWLLVRNVEPAEFSRENPLRSSRSLSLT